MRQRQVFEWAVSAFGEVARDRKERARRFVEEAIEVAQSQGLSVDDLFALIERTYMRPAGHTARELAQAQLALEALAERCGYDLHACADEELVRIKRLPSAYWQARQAEKAQQGIALPPEKPT